MGELKELSISRRNFLKYGAASVAAVVGGAAGYWAYEELKKLYKTPTVTPTPTTSPTPTPTLNPVVRYALDKGIDAEVANRLDVLNELNESNKTLVDYLYNVKELILSEEVDREEKIKSLQIKLLDGSKGFDGILTDKEVSNDEANALRYLSSFPENVQVTYIDFSMNNTVSSYLSSLSLSSSDFAKWATERRTCVKDHEVTDLEKAYLRENERYGKELFDRYILDSSVVSQELSDEIEKLPDLKEPVKENIDALEGIICSYKYLGHKTAFERMMEEGVKDKRKYCTSLQALTWILYDGYDESILEECLSSIEKKSLEPFSKLLNYAWLKTSTSKQYTSDRWKSFDEVIDRLNSPDLVMIYTQDNFKYQYYPPPTRYLPARQIFQKKHGVCVDFATFQSYLLRANGYDAWNVGLAIEKELGHNVCGYVVNDSHYALDKYGQQPIKKVGPFSSWIELGDFYGDLNLVPSHPSIRILNPFLIKESGYTWDFPWILIRK